MILGSCLCGQVTWRYSGVLDEATVCNCGACRRYGAIWIYGVRGSEVFIAGETRAYVRDDADGDLEFHTCTRCGALHSWQPVAPKSDRYRMAVNLRLADPESFAELPVRRFDGRASWSRLDGLGRCAGDYIL